MPAWRTARLPHCLLALADLPARLPCLQDTAVRMYETMIKLQTVDTIFYEAQRQVGSLWSRGEARCN